MSENKNPAAGGQKNPNPNPKNAPAPELSHDEQTAVRRKKLEDLRQAGRAYPHNIKVKDACGQLAAKYETNTDSESLAKEGTFELAGRVVFIRLFGKAGFIKIRDRSGMFQLYVAKDKISELNFVDFKSLDFGDIIKATGKLFRTKTGELSMECASFEIIVKCLHAPPEKFHGMTDVEERYRKRYLDLISSEDVKKTFLLRSKIVSEIRNYFIQRDFVEVETPILHTLVTGAAARPFKTHHNTLDMGLVLRIAPELHLKRLVVGGFERVFEMNRNFRNEGISVRHNPEFTMLEFYMSYATFHDLMDMTEELISDLCFKLHGKYDCTWQGQALDFKKGWKRLNIEEGVKTMSGYRGSVSDAAGMRKYLEGKGTHMTGREGLGALMNMIFEEDVQKLLIQPTFVWGHPVEISPLARRSDKQPESGIEITDRFELFVNGVEIANGFNELNDPDDQKARFEAQVQEKSAGNVEATDYDEDYIQALEYGLPPTAGEGIGIDRLTMMLTDSNSIRDVILFPLMRPTEE